jgi:hypothetical protein
MKINEIKYEKTFNLGNYESEKIGVSCAVDEGESSYAVLAAMKIFVSKRGLEIPEEEEKPQNVEAPEQKEQETPKVKAETETAETPKESSKPEKKKGGGGAKVKRVKGTPYTRESEIHKKLFSELLFREFPKWNSSPEGKAKGKEVSLKVVGQEFLDSEGLVIPSFLDTVRELMK